MTVSAIEPETRRPLAVEFGCDDGAFRGTVETRRIGDLDLVKIMHHAAFTRRSHPETDRADLRSYHLIMQMSGRSRVAQGGHAAVLHPPEMVLIDTGRPATCSFDGDSVTLSLRIPRRVLDARTSHDPLPLGRAIGGNLAAITAELMSSAFRHAAPAGTGWRSGSVREALLSLILSSLLGDGPPAGYAAGTMLHDTLPSSLPQA